jgi:hypothetical protein
MTLEFTTELRAQFWVGAYAIVGHLDNDALVNKKTSLQSVATALGDLLNTLKCYMEGAVA